MISKLRAQFTGRRIATTGVVTALFVAGGAAAMAAIPASDGTASSCYSTTTGALRVIDSGATCQSGEKPLSLQTGPSRTHWAQISPRSVTATSDAQPPAVYYSSTGKTWVYFYNVDITKCGVQATASDPTYDTPVIATISRYYGYVYVETSKIANGTSTFVDAPVDITVNC